MDQIQVFEAGPRRVLTIDVESVCRRLTDGLGEWEVPCQSIAEARTRLLKESFDAVLVVACGYGSKALPHPDVESIIQAAGGVPVLVILEGDDQRLGHFALKGGAFVVLVRGTIEPADIRRRVALAIEIRPLRRSDGLISECFLGIDPQNIPATKRRKKGFYTRISVARASVKSIDG